MTEENKNRDEVLFLDLEKFMQDRDLSGFDRKPDKLQLQIADKLQLLSATPIRQVV